MDGQVTDALQVNGSGQSAAGDARRSDGSAEPALSIAGLTFFMVDAQAKQVVWMESSGLDFEGHAGLCEAPLSSALRHLSQGDQRQILSLIQKTITTGSGGPIELGGDDLGRGLTLTATRYEATGGRAFVVAVADPDGDGDAGSAAVRGVAPLIRHLVESSPKSVLVVDSFGYVRYANDNFFDLFNIDDPAFCIGRNISHIPNRIGKTLSQVVLTTLARRAPADGMRRFFLASGDAVSLQFSLVPFRVSAGLGGVVFTAERKSSGDIDYAQIFNATSATLIVVDIKTRMIVAANQAARKAYALTEQLMELAPITETLLHPKTFVALVDQARKGITTPLQATVSGFDGVSNSKRLRASIIQTGDSVHLLIESKH